MRLRVIMNRYKPYFNEDINITKTSEFRKWFGNSKVIKGGNPLIVYHGSNSSFDAFDKKKIGTHTDDGIWGKGFYFSDKLTANHYGENVKEFFLHIENPYIIKEGSSIEEVSNYLNMDSSTLQQSRGFVRPYTSFIPLFTAQIKDKKHDGIIVDRKGVSDEYIVFSPNQIKSATENSGDFSVSSNNIYEDINIPLNKGDHFKYGKFKNKDAIYDSYYINDKGDIVIKTDTGKEIPACKIRLIQENLNNKILFHGSDNIFTSFNIKKSKRGRAIFLTSSKIDAQSYGKNIYKVQVLRDNLFNYNNNHDISLLMNCVDQYLILEKDKPYSKRIDFYPYTKQQVFEGIKKGKWNFLAHPLIIIK